MHINTRGRAIVYFLLYRLTISNTILKRCVTIYSAKVNVLPCAYYNLLLLQPELSVCVCVCVSASDPQVCL